MIAAYYAIPSTHRVWGFIYLLGEGSCRSLQYIIRPHLHTHVDWVKYFLGVAPNFLAGFYVPACLTFLLPFVLERNPSQRDYCPRRYQILSCSIALIGILGWEYLQTFTHKFYFDTQDLIWTFVGVGVYLIFVNMASNPSFFRLRWTQVAMLWPKNSLVRKTEP